MATYTIEDMSHRGKPFAYSMLLQALNQGEPFVTGAQQQIVDDSLMRPAQGPEFDRPPSPS